jgi:hypothetical protein
MENTQIILMNHILIVSALLFSILSILAIVLSFKALIEVKALQKSTHSVTWMPAESAKAWADDDKKIKEINSESKEFYRESGF